MRRLLYLITSSRALNEEPLFVAGASEQGATQDETEVVLLQEGVHLTQVPVNRVSVLEEDATRYGVQSPFPLIGYRDMVEKIFAADHVIRL